MKLFIPEIEYLDARRLIVTDDQFGSANVNFARTYDNIVAYSAQHEALQIVTGFIAATERNETTTLGRGGSDYTSSIFAAALEAREVQIWTDVDGVMTADPRKVKKAFTIDKMTYQEAMEISHFGAKVIHLPTMHPVLKKCIPIHIKNTFAPTVSGTLIWDKNSDSPSCIKGISSIDDISLLSVQGSGLVGSTGVAERVFGALAKHQISVILISQASSEHSICLAIKPNMAILAKRAIEEEFAFEVLAGKLEEVHIEYNLSIIAIVGEKMQSTIGVAGRLFEALGKNGINVRAIAQGSSELNISVVIEKAHEVKALNAVHEAFFLSDTRSLNVFLVGIGLVGKTLLQQIHERYHYILEEHQLDLKLVAVANSKKALFDAEGISFENYSEELSEKGSRMEMQVYVKKMQALNLPNSVFVDCTANQYIIEHYSSILESNISIVTPNKKANSGSYQNYEELQSIVANRNVHFLYETNVGAGLPVIHTLRDLMNSGDELIKIEGVLSGTLSYIFNSYDGSTSFSEVVQTAKEQGFTEPDPRDDLNGMDVARKLLILIRESGVIIEAEQISVQNLVSEKCLEAETVDKFFEELKTMDADFEAKRKEAEANGSVLRYVGVYDGTQAAVSLEEVDASHPFYNLHGSENMIVFTTKRYCQNPLVIKGPGAGAEVTAAGVFADLMRIAHA